MADILGEYVDRLCTIEMRPDSGKLPRGVTHRLYGAARAFFERPLSVLMAERLLERVAPRENVFIVTGAGGPPIWPFGEVDGLLGAAAIARALQSARKARPIFLAEERVGAPLTATCRAAGLNVVAPADDWSDGAAALYIPTPIDAPSCSEQASELLDEYRPSALVAIEKLAPNEAGVIHGATGLAFDDVEGKPQFLFEAATNRGILTCGIGDGGNEVGFGVIRDAVAEIMPSGRVCQCPCGAGSAASVATDLLVVGAISDWGAYGVAAMIAYLARDLEVFISEDDLERMLEACVGGGALDGIFARPVLRDDGVPLEAHLALITMLRTCLVIARSDPDLPGH